MPELLKNNEIVKIIRNKLEHEATYQLRLIALIMQLLVIIIVQFLTYLISNL